MSTEFIIAIVVALAAGAFVIARRKRKSGGTGQAGSRDHRDDQAVK